MACVRVGILGCAEIARKNVRALAHADGIGRSLPCCYVWMQPRLSQGPTLSMWLSCGEVSAKVAWRWMQPADCMYASRTYLVA
eukprot:366212-Chlamydomonas_euryale.AAC.9